MQLSLIQPKKGCSVLCIQANCFPINSCPEAEALPSSINSSTRKDSEEVLPTEITLGTRIVWVSSICLSAIASVSKKTEKASSFSLEKNFLPSFPVMHWLRLILPPLKDEALSV